MNQKLRVKLLAALLCFLSVGNANAQLPGGVAPAAWYRADASSQLFSDAGTTPVTDNAQVYQWNSQIGSFPLLQASSIRRPVYSNTTLANFNPTVTFDGSYDFLETNITSGSEMIDRSTGTIYTAGYKDRLKRSGFAGFHPTMDYPGMHVFSNYRLLFFTAGGPGYQGLSTDVMAAERYFTAGSGWLNGGGSSASYASATVSLDGMRANHGGSTINSVNLTNSARNFRIGGDSNYGSFSGQLNEVLVFENKLTEDQMDRVESYLAIKYGSTYANGSRDYKNAAGATVWGTAANAGYHKNIAGIARDDDGALYQKQSWSTNPGQQVLIGTGALASSNAANGGTLTDGQYLIWGDNGLAKTPTVSTTAFSGLSHHFEAVWKVQNTGGVGTVRIAWPKSFSNLTVIQSTDATIGAGDTATPMSGEVTINGVDYNYADVTLGNETYFTFAAKLSGPGGVTDGLLMWHKADDGTTTPGAKNIWKDVSGLGRDVRQDNNPAYQPSLVTSATYSANSKEYAFNFNPFYYLDGTNDFFYRLNDNYFPATNSPGSAYSVVFNSAVGGWRTPYGWGDDDPNLVRGNDNYYFTRDNGTYINTGASIALRSRPAHIAGLAWAGSANGLYVNVDGQIFSRTDRNIGTINSASNFAIGSEGYALTSAGYEKHQGGISEIFAYAVDHQNSAGDEKQRINSYLAIKYGITLTNDAGTTVPDYLSSASIVVWDATANSTYNNNIAGLARDDNSALYQKQSYSNKPGQQVLIGTTGLANTNAANASTLAEGQFLLWGDNGLSKTLGVAHNTTIGSETINLRFSSVWKVQNTGGMGTVRVAWPAGIVNLHLIQSADEVIESSDTHTPMSGTATVNGVVYNYADVTLTTGSYFTLGGYIAGPGGVGDDLSLWYRADNGVETDGEKKVTAWNNSTATEVQLTPSGSAYIPYNDQTTYTKTWNFNPTLTFDGTNQYLRNTTTDYLNTDGSVHYIAVARLRNYSGTYRSLFALSGNNDGFFLTTNSGSGTVTPMPTINNYVNASATGPESTSRFGIYSSILPRSGAMPNQRGFYNGLEKVYTSAYPRTGASYTIPSSGAYLGADGTTGDNFNGEIAEVILYHEPTGGDMTNDNLHRIHSYLAIKYGITLDQTTPQDYVNSGSDVVWNATDNAAYNKNIAGIGRDDMGGLNQKQSNSVNPGSQVLIGTTGLANTNAANTSGLTNGQFLIWGDNGLAKGPAVAIAGIPDVNYRFASIWKVQNTNTTGTVRVAWKKSFTNLKLIQSVDDVFDGTDMITNMAGTQVLGGVEYAYADVTLSDGQHFTFAAFVQGPGGVTNNLSYWYRADKLVGAATEDEDVDSWTDFTSGTTITQLGGNDLPILKKGNATYFNYNPGINFTGAAQGLGNLDVQTVTALNFDVYSLTKEGIVGGGNGRIFSSLVDNVTTTGSIWHWDGIGLNAAGSLERVNTARNNRYLANPGNINYASGVSSIMYNTFTDLTAAKGLNGAPNGTTGNYASARGQMTGGHAIGSTQFLSNGSDNAGFTGNIGELIIYGNGNNSPAERNKVESYLAIKYGITLDNSNNYTTSQDVVVWDATANSGYYNNVAGIGNDFISALHQKQSRSQHTNSNNQVIIALGDVAETNMENTGGLSDGQFLVWGDNGNTQAMTNTASTFTAFEYAGDIANGRRMNRVWKVQNTNNVANEVLIRFPKASVSGNGLPSFGANESCAAYVMIFADDANFTTNVTYKEVELNDDEVNYDVRHIFPNGASYFTYGKVIPFNQGVVYLPGETEVSEEYITDCAVGEWRYFNRVGDSGQKLIGFSGFTSGQMDNFEITITPEGTIYEDDTRTSALMARITTVTDDGSSYGAPNKVRVYYDQDELNATTVPDEELSGWFKYEGGADEVLVDIFSDGLFDPAKVVQVTPDASGVEDGVSYVEFHNVDSFSSFVYLSTTESSPLPVTLTSFRAIREGDNAVLTWSTANEQDNRGFEVESSTDARNWNTIGFVAGKGTAGNSSRELEYSFTNPATSKGMHYYRLKQIDQDGQYEHSHVVSLNFGADQVQFFAYPNPVEKGVISLNASGLKIQRAKVFAISGVEMVNVVKPKNNTLNVSNLPSGQYILQVVTETNETISKTIIIK